MACGNAVEAQLQSLVQEQAELHFLVADNAGVGCPAGPVLRLEGVDDNAVKFFLQIKAVKGKLQLLAGALRVGDLRLRTAAQAHGAAGGEIALILQQNGRGRAVHTAGHGG